jgi:amino acid transporter
VAVLLLQAGLGTIISLLYIFLPSVNQAYWILSAMTVELLCIVYLLVFAALVKLRYSQPEKPRAFTIPGGIPGAWLVGGLGAFGVIFTFIVGLLPPDYFVHPVAYILSILFGTFILAVPPLIFLAMKKPEWAQGAGRG